MSDTYPKYWIVHDTQRPIRQLRERQFPETPTIDGGWEPFDDIEALMEDTDVVSEAEFNAAVVKYHSQKNYIKPKRR